MLLGLAGCTGEGESEKVLAPNPTQGTIVVTPTSNVNIPLGQVGQLEIAEGVILEQVEISASVSDKSSAPDPQNTHTDIVNISPALVKFGKPAELRMQVNNPEQQKFVIAQLINGKWLVNYSSKTQGNVVTAEINEFGSYAVRTKPSVDIAKEIGPKCEVNRGTQKVRFVHVADLHANFGFAERHYSRIKQLHLNNLAAEPYTLFTNGGDDYEKGTVAEQLSSGKAASEAIKAMKFDVRVIGNHDYAWGEQELLDYSQDDNAVVLASNTHYIGDQSNAFGAVPFTKVRMGCITLGILGLTSGPWNALDKEYKQAPVPDFIENFKMDWNFEALAEGYAHLYGDEVDYMMMVSHLGWVDNYVVRDVPQIRLALGGHSHNKPQVDLENDGNSIVIEPDIYGEGAIVFDVNFTFENGNITATPVSTDIANLHIDTESIDSYDEATDNKITEIMARYAPNANLAVGASENYPDRRGVETVLARAAISLHGVDGAFLGDYFDDSPLVGSPWFAGAVTQEALHNTYLVERQPSNTSGFTAIYQVNVTGAQLKAMMQAKPSWTYFGEQDINNSKVYKVAMYKGGAKHPQEMFPDLELDFSSNQRLGEAWWLIEQYARQRTAQCLHLDTSNELYSCVADKYVTIWNFDDLENTFKADSGPAKLSEFKDTDEKDYTHSTTKELSSTPALPDGDSGVIEYTRFSPTEGFLLTHNSPANGDYRGDGLLSDYSVVMDLMWRDDDLTLDRYGALLQTNSRNSVDDAADIRFEKADLFTRKGGVGLSTDSFTEDRSDGYCGDLKPNTWYRLGFVFYAGPNNGSFKIYINGELSCVKQLRNIDKRWALDESLLLFTDGNWGTRSGLLNALLFAGRPLTDGEMKQLGGPSAKMIFTQEVRTLNQKVELHRQKSQRPIDNPWLQQRAKFFSKSQ